MIEVKTAGPLGYCSGVSHAIKYAQEYGDIHHTVFSLGTVAHNEDVVALLKAHGVEPISPEQMRAGTHVVITAHGAPPELYGRIDYMRCVPLDCTCPIVKKAQDVVRNLATDEFDIVIFGDPDHQEVKGLVGWAFGKTKFVGDQRGLFTPAQEHQNLNLGKKVGVVSQTTKSPADYADFIDTVVRHHLGSFQELKVYNTVCPIVAERIAATRKLAKEVDLMIVVGSAESANTRNLELASRSVPAFVTRLVSNEDQVDEVIAEWREQLGADSEPKVGVTAGTSTPIEVVEKVVARLKDF